MLRIVCLSRQTHRTGILHLVLKQKKYFSDILPCGKDFSIVKNVKIVKSVGKVVGTKLKNILPHAFPSS